MAHEEGRLLPYLQEAILALKVSTPAGQRDHDIRVLALFVMKVAHCTRERAIEWVSRCNADERTLLFRLRLFSKVQPRRKHRRNVDVAHCATPLNLHQEAWSKPR